MSSVEDGRLRNVAAMMMPKTRLGIVPSENIKEKQVITFYLVTKIMYCISKILQYYFNNDA